jgi:16S rRNA processing protein RimM
VTPAEALVPLGVIVGAHGLHGDVIVKLFNPATRLLQQGANVVPRRNGECGERLLVRKERTQNFGLRRVTLVGCNDRDAALALRGTELCLPRSELPALPEGEHYLIDLVGMVAHTPDGRVAGKVLEAIEYPAAHVLLLEVEGGVREVPFADPYIVDFEVDQGRLIVDHLEELDLEPPPRVRPR